MAMAVASPSVVSSPSSSSYSAARVQPLTFRPVNVIPVRRKTRDEGREIRSVGNGGALQVQAITSVAKETTLDIAEWNKKVKAGRLEFLEAQAIDALKETIENYSSPTFPCALITGDVVILDLLHRIGALKDQKVKIVFVDTFHLFPETLDFLARLEKKYGFTSHRFHAAGLSSKEEYDEKYGYDLFLTDVDKYDKICKVEPFDRALSTLKVDAMINGRRRDHGADRAHLEIVEGGAKRSKVQPLAYWEFRDCWDYIEKYNLEYHPLHDQGYPSIGDVQSTLPVPREQWFEYAGERSGRFQGLTNSDGSLKTECGIHAPHEYQI